MAQEKSVGGINSTSLIALTNADRAGAGLPALIQDQLLDIAAQKKADDMAAKGYFSHVSPDGTVPWAWFKSVQYYYEDAGENLAQGFQSSEGVNTGWMNSPTHHANLVNTSYTRIGIGLARGMYQGRETTFVVQFFAKPYVASSSVVTAKAPIKPAPIGTLTAKKFVQKATVKKIARKPVAKKASVAVRRAPVFVRI